MFIKKLQLKNFKRFNDLTIDLESHGEKAPKLVLLIGANGCGKSCVFDAFERYQIYSLSDENPFGKGEEHVKYWKKSNNQDFQIIFDGSQYEDTVTTHLNEMGISGAFQTNEKGNNHNPYKFYGRSAFRNVNYLETNFDSREFGKKSVNEVVYKNLDKTDKSIDLDKRWETDILYSFTDDVNRESLRNSLNKSLNRIFENNSVGHFTIESLRVELGSSPRLELHAIFKKGNSDFPYEYLSAGEKQLFAILFNLHLRNKFLSDTIVYLDEIDLHLNTSIQFDLLKEITENLIPENSQVWVASHSLGFIDYARESIDAAIIDFDNLDFDVKQELKPESKNKFSIFEIAINQEFLDRILAGKKIVFSENQNTGYYNNLKLDNLVFFVANDKHDVFYKVVNHSNYYGLIDRDYLSDKEIESFKIAYHRLFILKYYCFENYLYHPQNLKEYFQKQNKEFDLLEYEQKITQRKNQVIVQQGFEVNVYRARESYPFFKEGTEDSVKKRIIFQNDFSDILSTLRSDTLEDFYKVFSMKKFGGEIIEKYNFNKVELAQTEWFRRQIEALLK